jgi:hypothetical protein
VAEAAAEEVIKGKTMDGRWVSHACVYTYPREQRISVSPKRFGEQGVVVTGSDSCLHETARTTGASG